MLLVVEQMTNGDCLSVKGPLSTAGHTATVVTVPESSTHRKLVKKMIVIFGHSPQFGYLNTVQVNIANI